MKSDGRSLVSGFVESAQKHGKRPALFVNGEHFSYEALGKLCSNIAATIMEHGSSPAELAAVFAHRSLTAYGGVLGILAAGRGYVPLNPKFPIGRTRKMLLQSQTKVIVVGEECVSQLDDLLCGLPDSMVVILPHVHDLSGMRCQSTNHRFILADSLSAGPQIPSVPHVADSAVAYLLFTSGSTGEPKGVPVSHGNVRCYVKFTAQRYEVSQDDRLSQTFDMTFDLSVHDMFVSWERGACVYCVPDSQVMAPAKFIRDHKLTLWFSVPSVVGFMSRLNLLRPGLFPSLRYSLFCGEPLPEQSAVAWQIAAPNSTIDNLYGPTETTIAITSYRWHPKISSQACHNGIVPIGRAFDGQLTCIVDNDLNPVLVGEPGELLLSGTQLTAGYWQNPDQTLKQYVRLRGVDSTIWYRTGDRVIAGEDGYLSYLGRLDDQVKIRGFRVELQEVDCVLREATGSEQVVSVAWPIHDGSADGVIGFVCGGSNKDETSIRARCFQSLPDYMVPRKIYFLKELPLNANGKVDRRKLAAGLEKETHE